MGQVCSAPQPGEREEEQFPAVEQQPRAGGAEPGVARPEGKEGSPEAVGGDAEVGTPTPEAAGSAAPCVSELPRLLGGDGAPRPWPQPGEGGKPGETWAGATEAAERALGSCRERLEVGDALGAEAAIEEVIRAIGGGRGSRDEKAEAMKALRARPEYTSTLEAVSVLEEARPLGTAACPCDGRLLQQEGAGWHLACTMTNDPHNWGVELDAEVDQAFRRRDKHTRVYYRHVGKSVEVRSELVIPTQVNKDCEPGILGLMSMFFETALWPEWHPLAEKNGCVDLMPPRMHRTVSRLPHRAFFKKLSSIQEMRTAFDHEAGAFIFFVKNVPPDHPWWQQFPVPASYTKSALISEIQMVVLPRDTATYIYQRQINESGIAIPDFLLRFFLHWFMPESYRRLVHTVIQCCSHKGPFYQRVQADATGIYAEARRLIASGRALEDRPGEHPADQQAPRRSLRALEAEVLAVQNEDLSASADEER